MPAKPCIICVDDDKFILRCLKRELRDDFGRSYVIETAESVAEALEITAELRSSGVEIPLVIADFLMPERDGSELLAEIHAIMPATRTIMLSGEANTRAVASAVNKANLFRFIGKPWDSDDLQLTVSEALKSYQLDRELEMHHRELERANRKLRELNYAKNYFLSLLAHELGTPINVIKGSAKYIQRVSSVSEIHDAGKDILDSAERLGRFADYALLITRLLTRQYSLKLSTTNMYQLVREAIFNLREEAQAAGVSIQLGENNPKRDLELDAQLIERVLSILIHNAVKFSPHGGTVYLRSRSTADGFIITVSDEGPGFSEQVLEHIFEPFTSDELMHHSEGFGLGLSAAKVIMTQHNGDIRVYNRPEGGALVELVFPER